MKFCGSCGKQIPDEALACPYCGTFQESAAPVTKAKKPFPVKLVVLGLLAVAVVVGLIFGAKAIFGGGWEKPLKEAAAIANDKKFNEDAVKDLARCVFGTTGDDELDAAIAKAFDIKIDGRDVKDLSDFDYLMDDLDDEYGKDWKVSYEVTSRESIDSDDLEDYEDVYHDLAKLGSDVCKQAKSNADGLAEYMTDGELEAKDLKEIADHLKAFCTEMKDCSITKGYELEVTFKIEGEDGEDEIDYTIAVIKLDGKWVVSLCHDDLEDLADEIEDMDAQDLFYEMF